MVAQTRRPLPRRTPKRRVQAGRVVLSDTATAWPVQTWNQGQIYPDMPKIPNPESGKQPDMDMIGAPGVTIMSGILDPTSVGEYNPDFGWLQGIQIYDTMRRNDGQIQALEHMVTMPFHRAKWTIKPGGDDAKSKEIADFIETCLFHDMSWVSEAGNTFYQSWSEILRHILLHIFYGFSLMEVCWKKEDGWVKWARWTPLMQRTLYKWWVDNGNDLTGIEIYTWKNNRKEYIDIPIGKLLHFVYKQEGNNPEGMAGLRPVYKHWYYKDRYYAIEAVGIERSAVSPPVFKHGPNPTTNDITRAQDLVENIRVNERMGATIRHDEDLEILRGSQKQAAQTQPAIEHHDNEIARAFLVQFLNLGSKEVGSYALAQGQIQMFLAAYQAIASYIADIINPEIRRLVDWNYENVEVYPTLQCSKLIAQDLTTLTTAWKDLNSGNAPLLNPTPEIQEYMLEELGLPQSVAGTQPVVNPTAPTNPDRPDKDPQDHETKADNPPNLMSETLTEARLLREAMTSLDAVEKGYQFFNPRHEPAGSPIGGHFAPRGGGAGGGSEHLGRGSGRHAIEGVTHVSRGAGGSGGGGGHGSAKEEDIHAKAARLQKEQGLRAETQFTPNEDGIQNLTPIAEAGTVKMDAGATGLSADYVRNLVKLYGEHQLGVALSGYSMTSLREAASGLGVKSVTSKAALISAITSHVTEGRYSADFRSSKGEATSTRSKSAKSGDTISRAEHERAMTKMRSDIERQHAAELKKRDDAMAKMQKQIDALKGAKGSAKAPKEPTEAEQIRANKDALFKAMGSHDNGLRINSFNHLDQESLSAIHKAVGSEQLKDALYASSATRDLRTAAKGMGIYKSGMSHEEMARAIAAKVIEREGHIPGPASHLDEVLKAQGGTKARGSSRAKTEEDPRITAQKERIAQEKAALAHVKGDGSAWNSHQAQINDAETKIEDIQRENGTYRPNYRTKMSDEEFRSAFMRVHAEHAGSDHFADIRTLQKAFHQQYGMSAHEFSHRMNDMRDSGRRGEHPFRLHYEEDEERLHLHSPHFYRGQQFDDVEAIDTREGSHR